LDAPELVIEIFQILVDSIHAVLKEAFAAEIGSDFVEFTLKTDKLFTLLLRSLGDFVCDELSTTSLKRLRICLG
jgi:hypothetical protein